MASQTQLEDTIGEYTKMQQQFLDTCLENKTSTIRPEWQNACQNLLGITHKTLTDIIQVRAKLAHNGSKDVNPKHSNSEVIDQYFNTGQTMLDDCMALQQNLIDNWFSAATAFEKAIPPASISQNAFKTWEDAAEKILNTQKAFISSLETVDEPTNTAATARPKNRAHTKKEPKTEEVAQHH